MKKKVMVVDDHADQILTVKMALEDLDDEFEVIGVDSGMKCLKFLENGEIPDVILTESRMSGMTGWELLDKLKEKPGWENIPVVFLTAWTDLKPEKFRGFSADDFIEKPFDREDLKIRIDTIMKK